MVACVSRWVPLCVAVAVGVSALRVWWAWLGVVVRVDALLVWAFGGLWAVDLLLPCVWRFMLAGVCSAWMVWGPASVGGAGVGGWGGVLGVCASTARWTGPGRLAVSSGVVVGSPACFAGWRCVWTVVWCSLRAVGAGLVWAARAAGACA